MKYYLMTHAHALYTDLIITPTPINLLTNKWKLEEALTVTLSEECSAILQNKIPYKLEDLGSFTIPCFIGDSIEERALVDLGSSINLIPYKIFQKLELGELRQTKMILQLVVRSIRHPRGVVKDLFVKVDKFVFPKDFIILDLKEDVEVLGRPFLPTSKALIDVTAGRLELRMVYEKVTFRLPNEINHFLNFDDSCYWVDIIDDVVDEHVLDIM